MYEDIKEDRIVIKVCYAIGYFLLFSLILYILYIGLEREEYRLEKVREHNCKYYGEAINKHYNKELCDAGI